GDRGDAPPSEFGAERLVGEACVRTRAGKHDRGAGGRSDRGCAVGHADDPAPSGPGDRAHLPAQQDERQLHACVHRATCIRRECVYSGGRRRVRWHVIRAPSVQERVMASPAGYLRRLTRRLTEDIEELDAEEMAESSHSTGALPVVECARGQEVTMYGRLRSVESCSRAAAAVVEAEFFDGTDSIQLVWIGR